MTKTVAKPDYRTRLYNMANAIAERAFNRMMRDAMGGVNSRLRIIYTPAQYPNWGDLEVVGHDETLPGGWIYADYQNLPTHFTHEHLSRVVFEIIRKLPLIGEC